MIGFAFDYANVASLLALKPTCALADELGIAIEWLPFGTLVRDVPESVAKSESVGQRHTRVRAEYFAKEAALYARWQGIELNRASDGVDSTLACAGGLSAGRHGAIVNPQLPITTVVTPRVGDGATKGSQVIWAS